MQKIFLTFEFFNTVVQKISFGVQKKTIDLEFVVLFEFMITRINSTQEILLYNWL